jgi:small subunit ribosomal protein S4
LAKKSVKQSDPSQFFYSNIARRIDSILYFSGVAVSPAQAAQIVSHKHVLLNNKVVNIRSIRLKEGDLISFRKKIYNIDSAEKFTGLKITERGLKLEKEPLLKNAPLQTIVDFNKVFSYLL